MKLLLPLLFLLSICSPGCRAQRGGAGEEAIAFPGAEGFGKYASGGRGGKVMIVENLNDSGPGSFREAAESKGRRIIVFEVSGTIHLEAPVEVRGDVTIAGQSAPGDGICIADHPVTVKGDNVIIRYLRFRMGDRYQNKGMVPGAGHDDAFSASNRKHLIIDHCSFSWSTDEVLSVYNGDSTTLQWNLIYEPLNYSYHFEKGDTDFENHGYGGIWGGKHLTAHHNLFAHCLSRNPRFNGIRQQGEELVDYRNNVIYNWGANNVYGGEGGRYNIVNNYYKWGPSTKKSVKARIVNPTKLASPAIPFGQFFVQGNYVDGAADVTANNDLGIHFSEASAEERAKGIASSAFASAAVPTFPAVQAYEEVLARGGASHKRDTLDARIIRNVKERSGAIIDVQGGFPHGTAYAQTVGAWPMLKAGAAPADSDRDGMPDAWEKMKGLNPADATDARATGLHRYYTNVEVYLNSLLAGQ